ncbi:MAG: hypothetical protein WCF84_16265 [Anaerolineae bacterium]
MSVSNLNPDIKKLLDEARRELTEARAEKLKLFPPNPHPFAQPDAFPGSYMPEQVQRRNELNARIEQLENRIEELQRRLYVK